MSHCQNTANLCLETEKLELRTPISLYYPVKAEISSLTLSLFQGNVPTKCNLNGALQEFDLGNSIAQSSSTSYVTIEVNESAATRAIAIQKSPVYFQLRDSDTNTCVFSPPVPQIFNTASVVKAAIAEDISAPATAEVPPTSNFNGSGLAILASAAAIAIAVTMMISVLMIKQKSITTNRQLQFKYDPESQIRPVRFMRKKEPKSMYPERTASRHLTIDMKNATYLNSSPDSFQWTYLAAEPKKKSNLKFPSPTVNRESSIYWESNARKALISETAKKYGYKRPL